MQVTKANHKDVSVYERLIAKNEHQVGFYFVNI